MTEATHFSQCVHDQQRRLEADDCDSIRCAQLISGGRRRIRPPCTVPRSRSPHNVLHSPSIVCTCSIVTVYVCLRVMVMITIVVLIHRTCTCTCTQLHMYMYMYIVHVYMCICHCKN